MRNPRVLIFPLLVLLVAGLVWFLTQSTGEGNEASGSTLVEAFDEEGEDLEVDDEPATGGELGARVVASAPSASPGDGQGEDASYLAALGGLKGRLVWEKSEEPLVGVEIRAIEARVDLVVPTLEEAWNLVDGGNPLKFRVSTKTDAEGRFVLRGLHPRAIHLLGIGLKSKTAAVRFVPNTPQVGQTVDMGDVEIRRRGTITGFVQDAQGKPVAGARVRGLDIPQIAFQFGIGEFRPDGVVFGRMGSTAVVIPMPSWIAEIDALLPFADTTTRADGSFTLEGVRRGAATVLAQKDGQLPLFRATRVRADKERSAGTLRFRRGSKITLRFVDSDGNAVTSARAAGGRMFAMAPFGLCHKPMPVDENGSVVLGGLPRGKVHAVYQLRRGAPWQSIGPLRDGETKTITLPALRSAIVKVVDEKREPIVAKGGKHEIHVSGMLAEFMRSSPFPGLLPKISPSSIEPVAEMPGAYRVSGLLEGSYNVHARVRGYAVGAAKLEIKKGVDASVEVVLARGTTADFVVIDAERKPVTGARVYWNARRGTPKGFAGGKIESPLPVELGRTDEEGKLSVDNVPPGATRFVARHPAHAVVADRQAKVQTGKAITLQMGGLGSLEISVTERGSRPSERISLLLEPRVSGDADPFVPPRFVMTDEQGMAKVEGLQPADWRVERAPPFADFATIEDMVKAMTQFNRTSTTARAEVKAGQTAKVALELDLKTHRLKFTGSIHVAARMDGKALAGYSLQMWGRGSENVKFDSAGRAALTNLEDGSYWVTIRDTETVPPRSFWRKRVEVKGGNRVDLEAMIFTGTASVRVREHDGSTLAGIAVELDAKESGADVNGLTNEEGVAVFESVPVGEYWVRVRGRRGGSEDILVPAKPLRVAQGQRASVDLVGVKPAYVEGSMTLDTNALTNEQREVALEIRPRWGQFESSDGRPSSNRRWIRLQEWKEASQTSSTFKRTSLAPGTYRFKGQGWSSNGSTTWTSADLVVPPAGLAGVQVLVRPSVKDLDRILKARAKAKKK